MATSVLISGQETVYTFQDQAGNPHTEAFVVGEFLSSYMSGGVAVNFSRWFRGINEITFHPVSGAVIARSGIASGEDNLRFSPRREDYATPASCRVKVLTQKDISGWAMTTFAEWNTNAHSGLPISGVRFLARVLGY